MAAAVISCSPSFLASTAGRRRRPISPMIPSPFFLRPSAATGPLSFFPPLSTCNGKSTAAFAASNRKFIEEDYLVKKVTAEEVEELVKGERRVPIVLDFYATWCGPCTLMAQDLEMVDTDDEHELAQGMQVRGLPTLYFISPDPNKNALRTEGLIPREMIKNIIDNEM